MCPPSPATVCLSTLLQCWMGERTLRRECCAVNLPFSHLKHSRAQPLSFTDPVEGLPLHFSRNGMFVFQPLHGHADSPSEGRRAEGQKAAEDGKLVSRKVNRISNFICSCRTASWFAKTSLLSIYPIFFHVTSLNINGFLPSSSCLSWFPVILTPPSRSTRLEYAGFDEREPFLDVLAATPPTLHSHTGSPSENSREGGPRESESQENVKRAWTCLISLNQSWFCSTLRCVRLLSRLFEYSTSTVSPSSWSPVKAFVYSTSLL